MANPADTRVAPSAHPSNTAVTQSGTFDPASWLSCYAELGGVYTATDTKLSLCILVNHQTDEELSRVREMVAGLTDDDKAAVLAHLNSDGGEATSSWIDIVAKHEAAYEALNNHPYGRAYADDPNYDALCREHGEILEASERALRNLVTMPAPSHAALVTKLRTMAKEYGDTDGLFGPLIADVARLGDIEEVPQDDPVARYRAAADALILEDPASEAVFYAALDDMDRWSPTTCRDALRKYLAMYEKAGLPNEEREQAFIAQVCALVGEV